MDFNISKTKISVDFSFFLLLSFAVFYGCKTAFLIVLFSSLHEMGHIAALLLLKTKPDHIKISFYGISMKYDNKISRLGEVFVILSGPAVNFILYLLLKEEINLVLLFINLYPVLPLDGGRIVYLISEKLSKIISLIFLVLLLFTSLYIFFEFKIFSLIFIVIYLIIFNLKQMRYI